MFDPELIVNDESLSLENGAVEAWRKNGKRMNIYYSRVLRTFCRDFGASYTQPYKDMPEEGAGRADVRHGRQGRRGHGHLLRGRDPQPPAPLRHDRERVGEAAPARVHERAARARRAAACG
jgi:hypothetical protein